MANAKHKALKKVMSSSEAKYHIRKSEGRHQKRLEGEGYGKAGHNLYFHPSKGLASHTTVDLPKRLRNFQ